MKYKFQSIPDPEMEGGFFGTYIEATSKINPANKYRLEIDHDLCAPIETWTLHHYYTQVIRGESSFADYVQQVYMGQQLTNEQRDMMVELVMESNYLDFGEFV